jgi:hypothetical protein
MSRGSLAMVRERLGWARESLDELNRACDAFVYEQPDGTAPGVRMQLNAPEGWFEISVLVPIDVPSRLAKHVGEGLLHLRGTLDNLAWQLVLANGGTPDSKTEFPVFKDEAHFDRRAPRKMRGMSADAVTVIKELQPFNAWPEHPDQATVWVIHDLNLIDKHRLPHLACLWLATIKGKSFVGTDGRVAFIAKRGCTEHDAKLLRVEWDAAATRAETKMQMDTEISFDIALRNPGQVQFMTDRQEPVDAMPMRYFFEVGIDYLEKTVLPRFKREFG